MNSKDIFVVIEMIAGTSSKNEKEAIIRRYNDDMDFKYILKAALDPFVTYGMAKVPAATQEGSKVFSDHTTEMLDQMARRELTGNAAINRVQAEMNDLDQYSAELLKRIITKDLRAGFSESTVNKAIPGLIPTFDCMLAHPFEEGRMKSWPMIAEPKLDGVRVLAFVDIKQKTVGFFSRSGKPFTTFEHLKGPMLLMVMNWLAASQTDLQTSPAWALDGEVVSGSFNKTVGDVRRKSEQAKDAKFYAFDLLPIAAFSDTSKGGYVPAGIYTERRARLETLISHASEADPVKIIPRYVVNSVDEIFSYYKAVRGRGLEGLLIKDPNGLYHRRRNHAWSKVKNESTVDVLITDVQEGTGKFEGSLGALIIDFNGVKVNVGSGLSDSQREEFWRLKEEVVGRLCEVEFHEVTEDGSLRHPRFVRFRDDKTLEQAA